MALKLRYRGVRLTTKSDNLIEKSVDILNKNKLTLNGDDVVYPSTLITYLFEKLSEKKEGKEEALLKFFNLLELKDEFGNKISSDMLKPLVLEIFNVK